MTLWRRVLPTIVVVSLVAAFVGTFSTVLVTARISLSRFEGHLGSLLEPMTSLPARCAAQPAFSTTDARGNLVRTFDLDRLPEGSAGPDPMLLARLRDGEESASRIHFLEEYAGAMLLRRGDGGPCSLVEIRWKVTPVDRVATLLPAILLGTLSAGLIGLLCALVVVRPLIHRVQRLGRAAAAVGDVPVYASAKDPGADELGMLSSQLDGAHRRIRAATEALLDRNRSLESHLSNVAHDLKTPLSALQLALESLARAPGAAQETARDGLDDCVYLAAMIDNLRVESQLAEGMDPGGEGARAEANGLVGQVVRRLRLLGRLRGLEVDRADAGGEVWVGCRPLALERVVDNLVGNAVRHGRPGGHVAVLLGVEGTRFVLTVLDDGVGVPPDEFPLLGRKRFRGRHASAHGTGLGLSIVAEVCRRCGWELRFEPNTPTGLRVVVSGPAVPPPEPELG